MFKQIFLTFLLMASLAASHYAVFHYTKKEFFKLGMLYGLISAGVSVSPDLTHGQTLDEEKGEEGESNGADPSVYR